MKSGNLDREEFYQFLSENQEKFYRFAFGYVKEKEASLDVVQEAVTNALASFDSLKQPEFMKTWFYRILINTSISYLRKNKKYVYSEDILTLKPDTAVTENVEKIDLYKAIMSLNNKLKTVVVLKYFEGLKISEIAIATDTPEGTVKTRLRTALDKLSKSL